MNSYSNLKEIAARKERVRDDIARDSSSIVRLFNDTFVPKKPDNRKEMISRAVNIGFIVFDGIMLAKKLDNKYAIVMKGIDMVRKIKKKK